MAINELLTRTVKYQVTLGVTTSSTQTNLIDGWNYSAIVSAVNAFGAGPAVTSNEVVPNGTPTVSPSSPAAPSNVNAVSPGGSCNSSTSCVSAGGGSATVSVAWSQPSNGQPVNNYSVTVQPGGNHFTVSTQAINVQGLTAGTIYTFTVAGNNGFGTGGSTTSNSVTAR